MFNIIKFCEEKKSCNNVSYNKIVTGGNNPQICCKMAYAQNVRNPQPNYICKNKTKY